MIKLARLAPWYAAEMSVEDSRYKDVDRHIDSSRIIVDIQIPEFQNHDRKKLFPSRQDRVIGTFGLSACSTT